MVRRSIRDVFPRTADVVKGLLEFRHDFAGKVKYFSPSDMHREWFTLHLEEWCAEQFLTGNMKIRGATPLPEELPSDQAEAPLVEPQLLVATWDANNRFNGMPTPTIPADLIKRMGESPDPLIVERFGELFGNAQGLGFNRPTSTGDNKRSGANIPPPPSQMRQESTNK